MYLASLLRKAKFPSISKMSNYCEPWFVRGHTTDHTSVEEASQQLFLRELVMLITAYHCLSGVYLR